MSEVRTSPNKKVFVPAIVGALAGTAFMLATHEDKPVAELGRPQEVITAAEAVARRFDCTLKEVVNIGLVDKAESPDGAPRDRIQITLNLQDTEQAKPYLERYKNDDTVAWLSPSINGTIVLNDTEQTLAGSLPIQNGGHIFPKGEDVFKAGTHTVELLPRQQYREGTKAEVFIHQTVYTFDDENSYETTGNTGCGTLIYTEHGWQVSVEPLLIPNDISTNINPFQK